MPHVTGEGISKGLPMLAPLRQVGFWIHTVRYEEPIDKLICGDRSMFGDEIVDMRRTPINDPSAPTAFHTDLVHEHIVAGPMFHQP